MFYTRGKGFNPSIFCHVPPLQRPSDEDPNADQSMCLGQSFEGGKGVSKNSSDSENWSAKFTTSYVSLLKLSSCIWPLSFSRWKYPSFFLGILVESVDLLRRFSSLPRLMKPEGILLWCSVAPWWNHFSGPTAPHFQPGYLSMVSQHIATSLNSLQTSLNGFYALLVGYLYQPISMLLAAAS